MAATLASIRDMYHEHYKETPLTHEFLDAANLESVVRAIDREIEPRIGQTLAIDRELVREIVDFTVDLHSGAAGGEPRDLEDTNTRFIARVLQPIMGTIYESRAHHLAVQDAKNKGHDMYYKRNHSHGAIERPAESTGRRQHISHADYHTGHPSGGRPDPHY